MSVSIPRTVSKGCLSCPTTVVAARNMGIWGSVKKTEKWAIWDRGKQLSCPFLTQSVTFWSYFLSTLLVVGIITWCLSFSVCKLGITMPLVSSGGCVDSVRWYRWTLSSKAWQSVCPTDVHIHCLMVSTMLATLQDKCWGSWSQLPPPGAVVHMTHCSPPKFSLLMATPWRGGGWIAKSSGLGVSQSTGHQPFFREAAVCPVSRLTDLVNLTSSLLALFNREWSSHLRSSVSTISTIFNLYTGLGPFGSPTIQCLILNFKGSLLLSLPVFRLLGVAMVTWVLLSYTPKRTCPSVSLVGSSADTKTQGCPAPSLLSDGTGPTWS